MAERVTKKGEVDSTEAESDIPVRVTLSRFVFSLGTRLSLCLKGACGSETAG